jgi:hypothetical protein
MKSKEVLGVMLKILKLIFLAISSLAWTTLFAQGSPAPDSSIIPEPVDSAFIEDDTDSMDVQSSGFEIDISIEEVQSHEIIGAFYNDLKYNLSLNEDTSLETTQEYVADMRAHRTVRGVIYNAWKPIPPNDIPFLLQFKQNIFTGFKPVQPLISFGF